MARPPRAIKSQPLGPKSATAAAARPLTTAAMPGAATGSAAGAAGRFASPIEPGLARGTPGVVRPPAALLMAKALWARPAPPVKAPNAPPRQAENNNQPATVVAWLPAMGASSTASMDRMASGRPATRAFEKWRPAPPERTGTAKPQQVTAVPTDSQMAHRARRPAPVDVAGVTAKREMAARQKSTTVIADWTATALDEVVDDQSGPVGSSVRSRCPCCRPATPLTVTKRPAAATTPRDKCTR